MSEKETRQFFCRHCNGNHADWDCGFDDLAAQSAREEITRLREELGGATKRIAALEQACTENGEWAQQAEAERDELRKLLKYVMEDVKDWGQRGYDILRYPVLDRIRNAIANGGDDSPVPLSQWQQLEAERHALRDARVPFEKHAEKVKEAYFEARSIAEREYEEGAKFADDTEAWLLSLAYAHLEQRRNALAQGGEG